MKRTFRGLAAAILLVAALLTFTFAADKPQTLTGTISDSMCGAKHMMPGSPKDCTQSCVREGSKFALVVGDQVYTLEGGDKVTLNRLAGEQATVTGAVKGNTIDVASVAPAKRS